MGFGVNILQLLLDQLGVNLRGADVRVAQHFLDGAEIRPVFQKMRRERVAQGVRRNRLLNARLVLVGLDDLPEALAGHALPADIHK